MAIRYQEPRVVVAGYDITNNVRSYTLQQTAGDLPTLTVEVLVAIEDDNLVEQTAEYRQVELGENTRAALIALGWTPPTDHPNR